MKKKIGRNMASITKEIKILRAAYKSKFGREVGAVNKFIPRLYSNTELEDLAHIWWLNGYLQGVRDER